MKIALFIPCYVNQFYPRVGIATYQLLTRLGIEVEYPSNQTCCGQPMANSGFESITGQCSRLFLRNFSGYDFVVSPSGSCVLHIKDHLKVKGADQECQAIRNSIFELSEFLVDIVKVKTIDAEFPFRVGLHQSCHGQRGLRLAQMSELVAAPFSKTEHLLRMVSGLELIQLDRKDECCGFGGTFCVTEEAVSVKMGKDRISDHLQNGAMYITGNDMSCLMHLEGILKRQGNNVSAVHIAQILNGEPR